jgi:hypothetical protein
LCSLLGYDSLLSFGLSQRFGTHDATPPFLTVLIKLVIEVSLQLEGTKLRYAKKTEIREKGNKITYIASKEKIISFSKPHKTS